MPTFRLEKYLRPELVVLDLEADDKPGLVEALAATAAARLAGTSASEISDHINEREKVQSTGIGGGAATPHAIVDGITRSALLVFRLARPVDYEALDDVPVDLVFLLLSPPDALKTHVRLLARLARIIGQEGLMDRLRGAASARELHGILGDEDSKHVY